MIHIVTGKINQGKTTWLQKHFSNHQLGSGLLSIKLWKDDDIYGYKAHLLPSGEEIPLLIHQRHYHDEFKNGAMIGPYHYSVTNFDFINHHCLTQLEQGHGPIYLDEIGMLELSGYGLDPIMKEVVKTQTEAYISVRHDLVSKVVAHYQIDDYEIIDVKEFAHV